MHVYYKMLLLTKNYGISFGVLAASKMSVASIENSSITLNQGDIGIGALINSSLAILSSNIENNKGLLANDFFIQNAELHFYQCKLVQKNPQRIIVMSTNSTMWIALSNIYIDRDQILAKKPYSFAWFEEEKENQVSLWTFNSSIELSSYSIDTHIAANTGNGLSVITHSTERFIWKEAEYASCKFVSYRSLKVIFVMFLGHAFNFQSLPQCPWA